MAAYATLMRSLIAARTCWRLRWERSEITCILTDLLGSGNALIWKKVIRIRTVTMRGALRELSLRASGEHAECYELAKCRQVNKLSEEGGRNERVASQRSGAALAGVTNADRQLQAP